MMNKGMMGKGLIFPILQFLCPKFPCPKFLCPSSATRHSAGSFAPLGGQRGGTLTQELRVAGVLGDGFKVFVKIDQLVP